MWSSASRFSLKFQQIVQDEQEANFISQLHAGKLNIMPWYDGHIGTYLDDP